MTVSTALWLKPPDVPLIVAVYGPAGVRFDATQDGVYEDPPPPQPVIMTTAKLRIEVHKANRRRFPAISSPVTIRSAVDPTKPM